MDKPRQRRSSGPRSFDRDEAVEIALRLFRRHGYEGVSIADLTEAIGVAPPSLYAAFGNKAGLYREALDRYAARPGAVEGMTGATTLEQAVAGLLDAAITAVTTGERGCMISTGLIACASEQRDLADDLTERRRDLRRRIAEGLSQWLVRGEADRLAGYLLAVQQGIAVQARDGASRSELMSLKDEVMIGIKARATSPSSPPSPPRRSRSRRDS